VAIISGAGLTVCPGDRIETDEKKGSPYKPSLCGRESKNPGNEQVIDPVNSGGVPVKVRYTEPSLSSLRPEYHVTRA
jgi:hypothetical protein